MNEPPTLTYTHLAPRGRPPRASSSSPIRQRNTDDILSNLTPRSVVAAFRNPTGGLKECMDAAPPAAQAFAVRAALASKNIHEWLEELSSWPWPSGGGSQGFEPAIPDNKEQPTNDLYLGSLLASDVAQYEARIDEIVQQKEELDVEEIKNQILHNHIRPLSRPGSPLLDSSCSFTSSLSAFARMDDLTALVTATTIQALPNLSKLDRLLDIWSTRLLILRRMPVFLNSIQAAETALKSGWDAIKVPEITETEDNGTNRETPGNSPILSREAFDVMKSILAKKVAKAGQDLDGMLNMLETSQDTLPEEWIDRMDSLEQDYGEWTVVCERMVRDAEMSKDLPGQRVNDKDVSAEAGKVPEPEIKDSAPELNSHDSNPKTQSATGNTTPEIKVHRPDEEEEEEDPNSAKLEGDSREASPSLLDALPIAPEQGGNGTPPEDIDSEFEFYDNSEPDSPSQMELPTLPRPRRDSDISTASTIVYSTPAGYTNFSSDPPDQGTPDYHRSPANTHSAFRSVMRSHSTSFNDMPTVAELPDDETQSPPKTPSKSVGTRDGSFKDSPSPKAISNNTDDQLQQQISEILESVPAKIHLTSEPTAINLNPPDFVMPTARKTSKPDPIPRSHSSLSMVSNRSSRAGTPSFTLAPAFSRNSRPRRQGGNQDIKLYHLSRSNGEAPIKLFIRCVGENGERVMVRVGGGWADLGEYLKEYATHHRRRSAAAGDPSAVEVKDFSRVLNSRAGSTPPSRPVSVQESYSSPATTPLHVRKTRKPAAAAAPGALSQELLAAQEKHLSPETPLGANEKPPADTQSSGGSTTRSRSRSSSRLSWTEEDSSLGMAGPRAKQVEMSEESRAWVESVKQKVRIASGGLPPAQTEGTGARPISRAASMPLVDESRFGELGKVGSTKRLFRKPG
ncbi:hypothetical protein V8F20_006351 [Naviculisporaceae sp. PSN 640]